MDYIRYALISGLAVVSYMLLLAWQDDYPSTATPSPDVVQTQQDNGDLPSVDNTAGRPQASADITDTPSTSSSDIPVVASSTTAAANVETSETLITVSTDVLNVTIDRRGGDIVFVSLPEHYTQIDTPDQPFVLLENTTLRTYVAQSGLIGQNGIDGAERALYTASADSYALAPDQNVLNVDLRYTDNNGVVVIKRFTFERDNYLIDIAYDVNNTTDMPWQANMFGQIKRSNYEDPTQGSGFGMASFLGFATTSSDDNYVKIPFDEVEERASHEIDGGWVALGQHYFISAFVPPQQSRNSFSFRRNSQNEYIGGFTSSEFVVAPNSNNVQQMSFYAGPKDQYRLGEIAPWLDRTIDYGWLWFVASPIYWLLTQINNIIGNYGWSILILTVIVKGVFFKLSATSYRSMANMRRVMPKMNQLKERYGDDKMKLQKATMELYKKEKINPFGGCLPMLVQMPVFIALYWVLLEGVELRHAPWILWINDLSVMDPFFVLPLLMGASMYVQFMLNPTPQDPTQAKIMKFMPVVMTIFFLWFPAGLVLYWLANSVLGIAQQWYITRNIEADYAAKEAAKS
ncbi:membrane protein insertase YidC [Pseudohongiella sp.]|uniref:Membrane protein insertase YidC n=1 Tax=marine sediment metagenome TaxID=412755 RepID=A0A0F9W9B3_9ZZZZ|nr:membrane protein insertase YidC [Pseudohongiella sp.]HDZ08656.1 membrane protein insertase YidC [Pseudohongiella sp.]HEA62272.1 membrane protein insertase YidC [Pseudohongiella sp.]